MKRNNRLQERRKKISKDVERFVKQSFDIVDRIHFVLKAKGMEQKDLARALGKTESEISKWMTGTHNFTIKTIAKIETVLGESVLQTVQEKRLSDEATVYSSSSQFNLVASGKKRKLPLQNKILITGNCQPEYFA